MQRLSGFPWVPITAISCGEISYVNRHDIPISPAGGLVTLMISCNCCSTHNRTLWRGSLPTSATTSKRPSHSNLWAVRTSTFSRPTGRCCQCVLLGDFRPTCWSRDRCPASSASADRSTSSRPPGVLRHLHTTLHQRHYSPCRLLAMTA